MESTWRIQAVRTLEYGPLNQPITAHVVHERYNKKIDEIAMGFVTIQKITPFQGTNTLDIRIVQDAPAQFEQARYGDKDQGKPTVLSWPLESGVVRQKYFIATISKVFGLKLRRYVQKSQKKRVNDHLYAIEEPAWLFDRNRVM